MKDKHDLVEDTDLKFLDENEHKRTEWMGTHSATKTKDLMDKNLIKLTKTTDLRLQKALGKGKFFCGDFSGL